MAEDADMRNELSDMQQRADQLADEVRATSIKVARVCTRTHGRSYARTCLSAHCQPPVD